MPANLISSKLRVAAFLDLGTNSARLLVVRFNPNRSYTVLAQQKEVVRLGEGEFEEQTLQPEAVRRTLYVCRHFVDIARSMGARDIIAVATSAVREAANQMDFVVQFRKETRLNLHVISGREEARLIYLGISRAINLGKHKALFLDIGGGSTEIVVGDQWNHQYLDSLKLGAIRLSSRFLKNRIDKPLSAARYHSLQEHIRAAAVRTLRNLRRYDPDLMIGSSGTIMNLADAACRRFLNRRLRPNDVIPLSQLQKVIRLLRELPLDERRKVPGINPDRADIIIGGAAILETLMQELNLDEICVSDCSLRDGLLADYLARRQRPRRTEAVSVRAQSVIHLGRICGFDEAHARQIAAMSVSLYDELRRLRLHDLGAWERELLEYATLLHDIGLFLSFNNHHAHSYYLIRNADLIGFDQREIAIMAATTFFHRKMTPRNKYEEFDALDEEAKKIVPALCLCLKIAESLDRGHDGNIHRVRLSRLGKKRVRMTLYASHDCRFEMWALENHLAAFEDTFGRQLVVRPVVQRKRANRRAQAYRL
ncbi:MAG: Ppx/GppA phosphatase family protein [Kiritimatiellia bacterium]|jgi:exopolyphosphatase/guanosine-5'-triphosphate,3'-diphosphate pyrophosphatase